MAFLYQVMLESEAAGGDVPMEQGTSGQEDGPVGQPAVVSIAESGRAPSFSPFSVAPPVGESSSDSSDTESDQSRDKQVRMPPLISAFFILLHFPL